MSDEDSEDEDDENSITVPSRINLITPDTLTPKTLIDLRKRKLSGH